MKLKIQIQNLWNYLKIQDNEILAVKIYDETADCDKYIVASRSGEMVIHEVSELPEMPLDKTFHMVLFRNDDGHFCIPSPTELEHDGLVDF